MFILICVLWFGMAGCGEDKSPTSHSETYLFKITLDPTSTEINLGTLPTYTLENEKAVRISELVDTNTITEPDNFAYRLVGSDGFYAHSKGNPDNTWSHIQKGYIILSTMKVLFDSDLGILSRYNIKDASEMKILRKIDFVTPSDSLIQNIVDELPHVVFQDSLNAVALEKLFPADAVDDPSTLTYQLIAYDDYSVTLAWEQVLEGFYVIDQDRVLYSNPDNPGKMKVTKLNRLVAQKP